MSNKQKLKLQKKEERYLKHKENMRLYYRDNKAEMKKKSLERYYNNKDKENVNRRKDIIVIFNSQLLF